jgi:hypothetical protein
MATSHNGHTVFIGIERHDSGFCCGATIVDGPTVLSEDRSDQHC